MTDDVTRARKPVGRPPLDVLRRAFRDPAFTLEAGLGRPGKAQGKIVVPSRRSGPAPRQADLLVALGRSAELYRTPDGIAFADISVDGRRETWAVRGQGFRRWLARRFVETERRTPIAEAVQDAVRGLEIEALAGSAEHAVHLRVAGRDGKLYLDLGDAAWRAVEIDAAGWRVVERPPLRFRRPPSLRALPAPEPGGSIDSLRGFLNIRADEDLVMVVAWALAALRDRGPYPVLVLTGEPGSAKSTCTAMLQALIDPNAALRRGLPRGEHELVACSRDSHVLAFDNLSAVPAWCADALCRLVSGGGFAPSSAGADGCSGTIGAARPVILNGIVDPMTRLDLADRAVFVGLPGIAATDRRAEAELWPAFAAERPRLLGVLLSAMVEGLGRLSGPRPAALPRMADFAQWATACETALWPAGTFGASYAANAAAANHDAFEGDPVAVVLLAFLEETAVWEGTATALLGALDARRGGAVRDWPVNARAMAERMRQLAGPLRKLGCDVDFRRQPTTRARLIRLAMDAPPSRLIGSGLGPAAPPRRPVRAARPDRTTGR